MMMKAARVAEVEIIPSLHCYETKVVVVVVRFFL
jgi:hypothetical protein